MSYPPQFFKVAIDRMLLDWAEDNQATVGCFSPYFWIFEQIEGEPGAVILPLYRMRQLPPPFTISDKDRDHGRSPGQT